MPHAEQTKTTCNLNQRGKRNDDRPWNGNCDWSLNPSDWSSGVPISSAPAEIQSGTATISTAGVAKWLTIDSGTGLNLDNSTTLTLTDGSTTPAHGTSAAGTPCRSAAA
jgi:hypothetical protein